jgi:hypothetical protein
MKWFLTVCLLACGVAFGFGSCGPQKDFCPTSNPDPADFTCHENNDASTGMGGQTQGPCDGASPIYCQSLQMQVCKQSDCPP